MHSSAGAAAWQPGTDVLPVRAMPGNSCEYGRMRAIWNGAVLAESTDTVVVEGNHYFPAESMHAEYFEPSQSHTVCGWKGQASYYTVVVGGERNADACWYYPEPKEAAKQITGRVAFWKGVQVVP